MFSDDNVLNDRIPQHVAIVMDGNGRWAHDRGLTRAEGHRAGVDSVHAVIQSCLHNNIPILSLFAFSSENWARPAAEVACLMDLFFQALSNEVETLQKQGVSIRFTGFREALSDALQTKMQQAEESTVRNDRLIVNVLINYGGRWDIVQATKTIASRVLEQQLAIEDINEALFAGHLGGAELPAPDLFIRTSGEQRLSNFFLWQLAYTELYFTAIHWPDFKAEEFEKALASFQQRDRRFGKVSSSAHEDTHV